MMNDPVIEIKDVVKSYREEADVLKKISLTVMPGEFITVVGPSGCGKTTLMRLINRMVLPDSGIIRIKGKNIDEWNEIDLRRSTGYVIQEGGLFPHMNIRQNMEFVMSISGWEKERQEERVRELASMIGLEEDRLGYYPGELSGGQQQRIGVARALAANPDLVLMDEPFGALDNITRKGLQKELKEIHGRLGVTFLFITHDIPEAFRLGDKVAIMNDGRIEQFEPPEEILKNPANEWVEEFVEK